MGVTGGGASDTLDPHIPATNPDIARVRNLYEPLVYRDHDYKLEMLLAESLTSSEDAMTWTATLRKGVRFCDGRPVTPADVRATFRRIMDPDDPKSGAASLTMLDEVVPTGDRTVEFRLSEPCSVFDDYLAQYSLGIVPEDFSLDRPVGTGPFRVQSFSPGLQSVFVRNEHYWRPGRPYLDELVLINFGEDDARINALLSSQVDAIDQVPMALVEVLRSDDRLRILSSETGTWLPFTMRVDRPPFDDVRVRQALRLVVDREQMVNQVLSGQGRVETTCTRRSTPPTPPTYPNGGRICQGSESAARGRTPTAGGGTGDRADPGRRRRSAQVFQQQAKAAGITVHLRRLDTTTFFGENYLKWDFAQSFWYTRNYLPQVASGALPDAPYNETHWDDAEFQDLVDRARRTLDEAERTELLHEAQRIEYERGGNIIWGFVNQVDAHQVYVAGLVPDRTGLPLSGYSFGDVWLG